MQPVQHFGFLLLSLWGIHSISTTSTTVLGSPSSSSFGSIPKMAQMNQPPVDTSLGRDSKLCYQTFCANTNRNRNSNSRSMKRSLSSTSPKYHHSKDSINRYGGHHNEDGSNTYDYEETEEEHAHGQEENWDSSLSSSYKVSKIKDNLSFWMSISPYCSGTLDIEDVIAEKRYSILENRYNYRPLSVPSSHSSFLPFTGRRELSNSESQRRRTEEEENSYSMKKRRSTILQTETSKEKYRYEQELLSVSRVATICTFIGLTCLILGLLIGFKINESYINYTYTHYLDAVAKLKDMRRIRDYFHTYGQRVDSADLD